MTIRELLKRNRSYRRFHENDPLDAAMLRGLVDLTRLCPSAANRQPLKYLISWTPERNARIFAHLRWAAALTDWPGPAGGERPAGYIVILGDTRIATDFYCDHGIAAQSILLGAVEQGLGGCIVASIDRDALRRDLGIPEHLEILLVLALGRPKEQVALEMDTRPDQKPYWRDQDSVHHVPKRPLDEILVEPATE
ncbi:MAG TPA: nitroreductase family protein [Planctomycetaceae bacterium]|nr:nitroreductase family protein [Planctomycetaceae bacterium]HIQ21170.1 nitroreductase family protein [Planctomycetota bacterium]